MTDSIGAQARAAITPCCSRFNVASRGEVKAIREQILTDRAAVLPLASFEFER